MATDKEIKMIPAMLLKAVVPKILDIMLRQFKGIEKIQHLVKYMEDENETDLKVKELEKRIKKLEKIKEKK